MITYIFRIIMLLFQVSAYFKSIYIFRDKDIVNFNSFWSSPAIAQKLEA
jgi:hypothetical protein